MDATPDMLRQALWSANEGDRVGEQANVVDGLFAISRSLDRVAAALEAIGKTAPGRPSSYFG